MSHSNILTRVAAIVAPGVALGAVTSLERIWRSVGDRNESSDRKKGDQAGEHVWQLRWVFGGSKSCLLKTSRPVSSPFIQYRVPYMATMFMMVGVRSVAFLSGCRDHRSVEQFLVTFTSTCAWHGILSRFRQWQDSNRVCIRQIPGS